MTLPIYFNAPPIELFLWLVPLDTRLLNHINIIGNAHLSWISVFNRQMPFLDSVFTLYIHVHCIYTVESEKEVIACWCEDNDMDFIMLISPQEDKICIFKSPCIFFSL